MIVYVFYNTFFKKIFLPTKVVGIYPVYLNESKLLFNIEGIDGKWYIKVSDNDIVYRVRDQVTKPELEEYVPYVLTVSRVNLMLIAAPIYNEKSRLVNYIKSEFTVGADQSNSICLSLCIRIISSAYLAYSNPGILSKYLSTEVR